MIGLGIILYFLLVSIALLWLFAGIKGKERIKFVFIVLLQFGVYLLVSGIYGLMGWPVDGDLPDKFQIHQVLVVEPREDNDGGIYVWATNLDPRHQTSLFGKIVGFSVDSRSPRGFRIEYSKEMHKQMEKLRQELQKGNVAVGVKSKKPPRKGEEGEGEKDGDGSLSNEQEFEVHSLPRGFVPDKDPPASHP